MPTRDEVIALAARRRKEQEERMAPLREAARKEVEERVMAEAAVKKEMELRKREEAERMAILREHEKRVLEEQAAYKKRCEEMKEYARQAAAAELERNRIAEERKAKHIERRRLWELHQQQQEEEERENVKRVKAHQHWAKVPCSVQEKWLCSKNWEEIHKTLNDPLALIKLCHCVERGET